jgi:hypothetical protein
MLGLLVFWAVLALVCFLLGVLVVWGVSLMTTGNMIGGVAVLSAVVSALIVANGRVEFVRELPMEDSDEEGVA